MLSSCIHTEYEMFEDNNVLNRYLAANLHKNNNYGFRCRLNIINYN